MSIPDFLNSKVTSCSSFPPGGWNPKRFSSQWLKIRKAEVALWLVRAVVFFVLFLYIFFCHVFFFLISRHVFIYTCLKLRDLQRNPHRKSSQFKSNPGLLCFHLMGQVWGFEKIPYRSNTSSGSKGCNNYLSNGLVYKMSESSERGHCTFLKVKMMYSNVLFCPKTCYKNP